jgi:hypothetical protein
MQPLLLLQLQHKLLPGRRPWLRSRQMRCRCVRLHCHRHCPRLWCRCRCLRLRCHRLQLLCHRLLQR